MQQQQQRLPARSSTSMQTELSPRVRLSIQHIAKSRHPAISPRIMPFWWHGSKVASAVLPAMVQQEPMSLKFEGVTAVAPRKGEALIACACLCAVEPLLFNHRQAKGAVLHCAG
jgi:hypothetical protein